MAETIQGATLSAEESSAPDADKQSSASETLIAVDVTPEGKNLKQIKCQRCPSTILVPEMATLVTHEFILPDVKLRSDETLKSDDLAKKYWCVDNMYAFENVGFSKTVDGVKYLICADCEIGPIGWHDLNTKLSYVSLHRISYC